MFGDTKTRSQYTQLTGVVGERDALSCSMSENIRGYENEEVKYPISCFRASRKCGWCAVVSDRQVAMVRTRPRKPEKNIPDWSLSQLVSDSKVQLAAQTWEVGGARCR